MMMTMKGEGKPPSRRRRLVVPPLQPLPLSCPYQPRPSPLLLFFPVSDLLECRDLVVAAASSRTLMMMTMKGEGKPPSRRRSLAVPPLQPLPISCPNQSRPSPLLLFFPVSDLQKLELTAGEPLLLHHGAATWSLPCFTTTQQRGVSSVSPPPASLPAFPPSVPVAEGIRATTTCYPPSSPLI
ncbi:uncharacterized protein DS421_13g417930 [Arachis hypogaea]|nr:uncharacterized protein DS421_13g417930 [Arachis hypogaea]